ncbi:homoserine kinase [Bartonella sp. HY038]|uniref:homoserine kinase n=1 Tax=Bartonella sp. HY038 TaxID=2759660 RepID=UPI0015FB0D6D|nr:homoserine kinase [Bartonella sp. HY038]
MAVYTDISEEQLAGFLNEYDVGTLLSYKGIAEGVENSNFLLRTKAGNFILTIYEKRVDERDLPFFLGLTQHLAQKGILCPQPILRKDGEMVSRLAGKPAALISFLEGMWVRKPTAFHCGKVGAALANLHVAGSDFPIKRKNSLSIDGWHQLWSDVRYRANDMAPDLEKEIDNELVFLEKNWPSDLPSGVIHADLFNDNVFFLDGDLSGIIDFYFACNDAFAYDLAICLNAWCFEADLSYNLTKGSALLSHYATQRQLSDRERDLLPILARGAALRFFLTRAYDWFFIDDSGLVVKKNPIEYLRKLRFFRQIVRSSELGLPNS